LLLQPIFEHILQTNLTNYQIFLLWKKTIKNWTIYTFGIKSQNTFLLIEINSGPKTTKNRTGIEKKENQTNYHFVLTIWKLENIDDTYSITTYQGIYKCKISITEKNNLIKDEIFFWQLDTKENPDQDAKDKLKRWIKILNNCSELSSKVEQQNKSLAKKLFNLLKWIFQKWSYPTKP
jgi:hypothetical protein